MSANLETPHVISLREVGEAPAEDRRGSGRRARARDRLLDRATKPHPQSPTLQAARNVENLLLFIDDDLRETALAMGKIESFLVRTVAMLECDEVVREDVRALAHDKSVLDELDQLNETLESLRRRLADLAARLQ